MAMEEASREHVSIPGLQAAVGELPADDRAVLGLLHARDELDLPAHDLDGVVGLQPRQDQLLPQLQEVLQDVPEGERLVYLKGDEELEYGQIMTIMDLCREAGVEEIALIAEPEVEG